MAFGSGAFTQVEAERDVSIIVEDDTDADLGLVASGEFESVTDDELTVDLDNAIEGVNTGAEVFIGIDSDGSKSDVDPGSDSEHAFKVVDNRDVEEGIQFDVDINKDDLEEFELFFNDGEDGTEGNITDENGGGSETELTVEDPDELGFAIRAQTSEEDDTNVDASITFTLTDTGTGL